jgi:hypothetical protein
MGKITISMVIFHSYGNKLPEGMLSNKQLNIHNLPEI